MQWFGACDIDEVAYFLDKVVPIGKWQAHLTDIYPICKQLAFYYVKSIQPILD